MRSQEEIQKEIGTLTMSLHDMLALPTHRLLALYKKIRGRACSLIVCHEIVKDEVEYARLNSLAGVLRKELSNREHIQRRK